MGKGWFSVSGWDSGRDSHKGIRPGAKCQPLVEAESAIRRAVTSGERDYLTASRFRNMKMIEPEPKGAETGVVILQHWLKCQVTRLRAALKAAKVRLSHRKKPTPRCGRSPGEKTMGEPMAQ